MPESHSRNTGEPPHKALRGVDPCPGASHPGRIRRNDFEQRRAYEEPFRYNDRLFSLTWAHVQRSLPVLSSWPSGPGLGVAAIEGPVDAVPAGALVCRIVVYRSAYI